MKRELEELSGLLTSLREALELEKLSGVNEISSELSSAGRTDGGRGQKEEVLQKIREAVTGCKRCSLGETRTRAVFGEGNANADLVFVGEAPGYEEDRQGRPFVGEAGRLLTKIIHAMGLKREDVFIMNVLKCRPPKNRDPLPSEVALCIHYLREQLAIIRPKIICTMGRFATQALLDTTESLSRIRGKSFWYSNIEVIPTFHPAYLLRNPGDKKLVWEDMKTIKAKLAAANE